MTLEEDMACVSQRATDAIATLAIRRAAARIAEYVLSLSRLVAVKLTDYFDWERLKINVAHLVAPSTVKFSEPSHG
jgi:CRP-like cAMP-binding protein